MYHFLFLFSVYFLCGFLFIVCLCELTFYKALFYSIQVSVKISHIVIHEIKTFSKLFPSLKRIFSPFLELLVFSE